jgi:hypothetical protein
MSTEKDAPVDTDPVRDGSDHAGPGAPPYGGCSGLERPGANGSAFGTPPIGTPVAKPPWRDDSGEEAACANGGPTGAPMGAPPGPLFGSGPYCDDSGLEGVFPQPTFMARLCGRRSAGVVVVVAWRGMRGKTFSASRTRIERDRRPALILFASRVETPHCTWRVAQAAFWRVVSWVSAAGIGEALHRRRPHWRRLGHFGRPAFASRLSLRIFWPHNLISGCAQPCACVAFVPTDRYSRLQRNAHLSFL